MTGVPGKVKTCALCYITPKAIDQRNQVIIKSYHSAHSLDISDRLVEPFAFDNSYSILQAYEPESEMNKFFKLERIGDLVLLNKKQAFVGRHQKQHMDCFGYAGDQPYHVQLQMSLRAFLLLREEYPSSISYLQADKDNDQYLFDGPVYQLEGIGRFVMGFLDQIRILSADRLKEYIDDKLSDWKLRQ